MATMKTRACGFKPWLPALALAAVLLAAPPLSDRLAAGQGLDVADPLLGADAAATANEFEYFEDALALTNSGGRGRGGRGGSGNLGGFRDVTDFQQLQAAYYYLGGAPQIYESSNTSQTPAPTATAMGLDYVPDPFDQKLCSTCVGQALAMAVRMSMAYTLRRPVELFTVSPLAFYYCTSGGRTCRTGWDIQPALAQMEANPQWLLPTVCLNEALKVRGRPESEVGDWTRVCTKATTKSDVKVCQGITKEKPLYTCTYKSLSSFYQIQQHIRKHGAVITRIAIPDDFEVQFNYTKRYVPGLKLGPYKFNVSAKAAFGHAAVIVGYDNYAYTWTVLNSWGSGNSSDQTRSRGGVTADGMFKISMGLAGVGTPEKSYGVACEPAPGSPENLNGDRPWLADRRQPLVKVDVDGEQHCYTYTTQANDTVASIVDRFDLDVPSFVRMNAATLGKVENYTYKFPYKLRAEEMSSVLEIVTNSTDYLDGVKPHFDCWDYNAAGKETRITCNLTSPNGTAACDQPGIAACTLLYQDVNTTVELPLNSAVTVCNDDWADLPTFNKVAYEKAPTNSAIAEEEAVVLLKLRRIIQPAGTVIIQDFEQQCIGGGFYTLNVSTTAFTLRWGVSCTDEALGQPRHITRLYVDYFANIGPFEPLRYIPALDEVYVSYLLDLKYLEDLYIVVHEGTLPSQLGALQHLKTLTIMHYCLTGPLPSNWIAGWQNLTSLTITHHNNGYYVHPAGKQCGMEGPIPSQWFEANTTQIKKLVLTYNMLSGYLPNDIGQWKKLDTLLLHNNRFSGEIPRSWVNLMKPEPRPFYVIDISNNLLQGQFPQTWSNFSGVLGELHLDGNAGLQGCVPLKVSYTVLTYQGTGISGFCPTDSEDVARKQRDALKKHLPLLMLQNSVQLESDDDHKFYNDTIGNVLGRIEDLGKLVDSSATELTIESAGLAASVYMTVRVITGTEFVTSVYIDQAAFNASHLPQFMKDLPQLESFKCYNCYRDGNQMAKDKMLPSALPKHAKRLKVLDIVNTGIMRTLPAAWAGFARLEVLTLNRNSISGGLPPQWSQMASLQQLQLMSNLLTGEIPSAWGTVGKMRPGIKIWVSYNVGITGSVPASYAHFATGFLGAFGTSTTIKCSPGSMLVYGPSGWVYPCDDSLQTQPEVQVLSRLKMLLYSRGGDSEQLSMWNTAAPGNAGPNTPPRFCRSWTGITCNSLFNVVGVDLSVLGISLTQPTNLKELVDAIAGLASLQYLNMAGLGVSGTLDMSGLEVFARLQHLDISNNPGIQGVMPDWLAGLTDLRVLNISHTGIGGSLPASYASLQQLQDFRAAGCGNISGQLPVEYGMLGELQVFEVSDSGVAGRLPSEWADPLAMRSVAANAFSARSADQVTSKALPAVAAGSVAPPVSAKNATVKPKADLGMLKLQELRLSGNKLTGPLPAKFAALKQLQVLDVGSNSLDGTLPSFYASLTQLKVLNVSSNGFTGPLPPTYVSLRQLALLDARNNNLDITIPALWGNMAGDGFSLQCLLLSPNGNKVLDESTKTKLVDKSKGRSLPLSIVVDNPGHANCNESLIEY